MVITLGVHDLERSLKFYRDGLAAVPTEGIAGKEAEGNQIYRSAAIIPFLSFKK